jgi:hypothetical protein
LKLLYLFDAMRAVDEEWAGSGIWATDKRWRGGERTEERRKYPIYRLKCDSDSTDGGLGAGSSKQRNDWADGRD